MATVKRFNKLLGLENIDVLVDDRETSRHIIITDMPQSLPQGKSSFLIEVSPYMKEGVELQIDFMDSVGNSIYLEPVQNYLEGSSRTISVEVYDTTSAGVATMIIVGEIDQIPTQPGNFSEVEEVPEDFKGVYNVRLTREVIINTAEINIQPIKFYSAPKLIAREKRFGTMEREVVTDEVISDAFTVIGRPSIQQQYEEFVVQEIEASAQGSGIGEPVNQDLFSEPPIGDVKGDEAEKEKLKQHSKKKSVRGDSRFKRSKRIRKRNSPIEYPYTFSITNGAHEFTTEEIGGKIIFSDLVTSIYNFDDLQNNGIGQTPNFNVVSDASDPNFPTHFTASIADLENSVTAFTNTPFTKQDIEGRYRILEMEATAKVHFTKQPSASFSLVNIVSYADITLSHLRTFSGELFKAKVYVRAEGSFDDYKLLAEVPIESPELMVNSNSVGVGERTGYFISEEDKDTYWDLFGSTNGLTAATSTSTASYDNQTSLDSIMVSGSTSVLTNQIRFQLKDDYKFTLTKNIDYSLSFNAVGLPGIDGRALMLVYVSGSSMKQKNSLYDDETTETKVEEPSNYGKRLGALEVEKGEVKRDFKLVNHNFNTDLTGDAVVQFRVIAGQWNLSDVSVVPSSDTGFSPSFTNFQQELPPELTHKRPETLEFLTEFYDINNNLADEIAVTTGSVFTGGNMVISGDDNTMSGDLFIGGDSTASGMHFGGVDSNLPETGTDGATGSGFMRSVGYLGFTSASAQSGSYGCMIYSGSVLPDSGDDYQGVGLELVGASGSLKFRTSPSLFDVQADSFFVGKTATQFISGSGEKIEISSSNFHLQPGGDVDMTGTITAAAGAIGGWEIKDGDLRAGAGNSSVTMSGDDQLIKMGSGSTFTADEIDGILFGKDTDGVYKFGIGKGGSYIFFDGDVVNIATEDINVTASVFSIDVDQFKLSATNLFISSSQGGFISLGNPRASGIGGTNKGIFMQGNNPDDSKPKFLAGDATGAHLSYDGDNIFMSSSAFFLGSPAQFVSGSLGNVEISSSNFHLDNEGNVIMSGKVTAAEGEIGGLTIGDTKLSSGTAYEISSSTNVADPVSFISSSGFKVSAGGQVTASALSLTGGDVGGLSVESGVISVGDILKLKNSGQITGSKVLFTGGTIGGFTIDADEIKSGTTLILDADSNSGEIKLGAASDINTGDGIYMNGTGNAFRVGNPSGNEFKFDGTSVYIGNDGAEHVKIDGTSLLFIDNSTTMAELRGTTWTLGGAHGATDDAIVMSPGSGVTIFDSSTDKAVVSSLGLDITQGGTNIARFAAVTRIGDAANEHVSMSAAGFSVKDGETQLSTFNAGGAIIGKTNVAHISASSLEVSVIKDSNNKAVLGSLGLDITQGGTNVARFAAVSRLGDVDNEHISMSADGLTVKDGETVRASLLNTAITLNGASTDDRVVIDEDGMEIYTANVLKASAADAGFTAFGDDVNTKAVMSSAGMTVFNDGTVADPGTGVSHFGANLRIGAIADNTSRLQIDTSGNLKIINRQGTTDTTTIELKTTGAAEFAGKVTATTGEIGGWALAATTLSSGNLILNSAGTIETSNFASGVRGWRIASTNNGEAEFENVRIRGTLSTAVFEKETVNAVGGQLYIANSTAITGSTTVAATATTMSVVNVSGFAADEILSAKKVSATGFGTEYMFVQSSSRDYPSSETDFAGKLYLVRGYRSGSIGISGSLGDISNISQSYEPGQVIVSTGKIGTGYIRLNANPNDQTTPYMDIVERTGSGVYDVDLKVRLGDLSGLSSGLLYGNTSPGFGLFTENVFLSGAITAQTGSIEGILHIRTDASNQIKLGTDVNGSQDGIHINDNNFWYTNGHFKTGFDGDNFIHQSGSSLTIKSETFDLDAGNLLIESATPKIALTDADATFNVGTITSDSDTTGAGVFMDGGGHFRVIGNATNQLIVDGGSMTIKSDTFDLDAGTIIMDSGTNSGKIALGGTPPTAYNAGVGVYLDGTGKALIGNSTGSRIQYDGTNIIMSASNFFLGSSGQFISGSLGNIEISSSNFHLSASGDVIMSGTVTATAGNIGGFTIDADEIKSTNILIDSTNEKITVGSANAVTIQGGGTDNFIAMGSKGDFDDEGTGTAGILIGMDATNPQAEFVKSATDYLIFDDGLDIKTGTFDLDAGTLILDSGTNSGKIALGGTPPTAYNTGVGVYFDGTGKALIGNSTGSRIQYDGDGTLIMSASNFFLGGGGQFVSGSNGNIEISSSKFHLARNGDVTMDGVITATDGGQIGGFTIEQSSLNPYVATTSSTLVAKTNQFNTASIVASDDPYMEFSSGDSNGHTVFSHLANGGKTFQKIVFSTGSIMPFKGFFNETAQSEVDAAYVKTRATSATGGVMTEYSNNKLGNTTQGQRILIHASSGSTGLSAGINEDGDGSKTDGAGIIFQYTTNTDTTGNAFFYKTGIVIGNIGTDLGSGTGVNGVHSDVDFTDMHVNSSKKALTHGILLTDDSRLVLTDESTIIAVNGTAAKPGICFSSFDDGFFHDSNGINIQINNAHDFLFKNGGEFHADADVIAFSTTISDERLKDDVKTIEFALEKIINLRGVGYTWNNGGRKGQRDLGVIAQEVEKIIPEIVSEHEMPLMDDSGKLYKTVDYEKLTAVLIEGMKEQQKQIDDLQLQIKEIKNGSSK